jgi:hypothetical protein
MGASCWRRQGDHDTHHGLDGGGREQAGDVVVSAVPWRKDVMMATVTGRARASDHVQALAGGEVKLQARGESEGSVDAIGRSGALSCPECASARSGMAWASWARLGASSPSQCRACLWPWRVQAGVGE